MDVGKLVVGYLSGKLTFTYENHAYLCCCVGIPDGILEKWLDFNGKTWNKYGKEHDRGIYVKILEQIEEHWRKIFKENVNKLEETISSEWNVQTYRKLGKTSIHIYHIIPS